MVSFQDQIQRRCYSSLMKEPRAPFIDERRDWAGGAHVHLSSRSSPARQDPVHGVDRFRDETPQKHVSACDTAQTWKTRSPVRSITFDVNSEISLLAENAVLPRTGPCRLGIRRRARLNW